MCVWRMSLWRMKSTIISWVGSIKVTTNKENWLCTIRKQVSCFLTEFFEFLVLFLDAHRALELLEDYHGRLNKPQDKPLKNAIERVIRIFKSRLFQALLGKKMLVDSVVCTNSQRVMALFTHRNNWCSLLPRTLGPSRIFCPLTDWSVM